MDFWLVLQWQYLAKAALIHSASIFAGTFARLLEVAFFCFGINQGLVYAGIVFGGLAYLVNVSSSSILSKNVAYHEQVRHLYWPA